jgi:hypothetical protein
MIVPHYWLFLGANVAVKSIAAAEQPPAGIAHGSIGPQRNLEQSDAKSGRAKEQGETGM